MTQNFIQPKGTLNTQTNVDDLTKQYAQMFANNQLQGQVQDTNPLRQTVNDLLQSKLLKEIEMPKYTTIQDIFNAQKGDKLNTFAEFLNNPQTMRMIGNFMSKYGYNPQTGKIGNVMEDSAKMQEALMQNKQQQAMKQMQEQYNLTQDLNKSFMQSDIADADRKAKQELAKEELDWKKAENALDRALKREELNAQIQHQRAMEGLARERLSNSGGTVTGGASNTSGLTPKQIQKNQEMLNSLNVVQSQMDRFANSFDKVRPTKLGALVANAYAGGGFGNSAESNFNAQRTLLFNKIARELGGEKGVLSDQDIKRIEGSLPSLSDSLPQKRAKMKAVYDLLEDRKSQYNIGTSSGKKDSLGLGI